jgi:hypothetical protein
MTTDQVIAEARSWIGVRYVKKGRSRNGIDCAGHVVMVARTFAIPHHDEPNYSDWPDPQRRILKLFDQYLIQVPGEPQPGMIGLFAEARLPGHAGFFSWMHDRLHIVHARLDVRKVIEHDYAPSIRAGQMRMIRLYKFPGFEA